MTSSSLRNHRKSLRAQATATDGRRRSRVGHRLEREATRWSVLVLGMCDAEIEARIDSSLEPAVLRQCNTNCPMKDRVCSTRAAVNVCPSDSVSFGQDTAPGTCFCAERPPAPALSGRCGQRHTIAALREPYGGRDPPGRVHAGDVLPATLPGAIPHFGRLYSVERCKNVTRFRFAFLSSQPSALPPRRLIALVGPTNPWRPAELLSQPIHSPTTLWLRVFPIYASL